MSDVALSHIVRLDRIPAQGKHVRIAADETARGEIARTLGIVEVAAMTAELNVRPLAGDAFGVRGTIDAEVVQTDVVTLEPVRQALAEEIDLTLVPAEGGVGGRRQPAALDPDSDEDHDVYRNGQIDLGAIAVEHLALGLDPYPRAPGVEFTGHVEDDSSAEESPFAALERLKHDRK